MTIGVDDWYLRNCTSDSSDKKLREGDERTSDVWVLEHGELGKGREQEFARVYPAECSDDNPSTGRPAGKSCRAIQL